MAIHSDDAVHTPLALPGMTGKTRMLSVKKIIFGEEKMMKQMVLGIVIMSVFLAGCASTKQPGQSVDEAIVAAAAQKPVQQVTVLEDKGSGFGIETPAWLGAYIQGGNLAVQNNIKDYKDYTVFIVETEDAVRDFAVNWVNGTEGPRAVAAKISTTVTANIKTTLENENASVAEANLTSVADAMTNAVFTGLSKNADWWRQVENNATKERKFQAYAIYIINKKDLDKQVAAYLQRFVDDKNKALSEAEQAIYTRMIQDILNGTGVELNGE
jgi:hypothetical protein